VNTKQIRLSGFGGQGIVLAGLVLSHAGIIDGKWVATTSTYGAAARGGACRSDIVISDQPIIFPQVTQIDIFVPMSQQAYSKYIENVSQVDGLVAYNEGVVAPLEIDGLKQVGIPATRTAVEKLENEIVANMIILGAMVELTGVVSKTALISTAKEHIPERFKDMNIKAIDVGFDMAGEQPNL
jgi:2-oxoglutarate ferredoxin oxidoreductase subunit gamma